MPKKDRRSLLATLQTYWLLKRRSRNGLPLLRRLQVAIPPAVTTKVCNFYVRKQNASRVFAIVWASVRPSHL